MPDNWQILPRRPASASAGTGSHSSTSLMRRGSGQLVTHYSQALHAFHAVGTHVPRRRMWQRALLPGRVPARGKCTCIRLRPQLGPGRDRASPPVRRRQRLADRAGIDSRPRVRGAAWDASMSCTRGECCTTPGTSGVPWTPRHALLPRAGCCTFGLQRSRPPSRVWRQVKRRYNASGELMRAMLVAGSAVYLGRYRPLNTLGRAVRRRGDAVTPRARGMSRRHDLINWVGGYPFEVAKPEEVFTFVHRLGFELRHLKTTGGGLGCNEYVFQARP